jgi:elongation factor P
MKISGVDIRPGNIIEYEGGIWRAVKIQHTQPGKGPLPLGGDGRARAP